MANRMIKKIKLDYSMQLITGLHIGDSSDNVEIGGIDKPVVRKTIENVPYIPGSSLKGKIRSLLEQIAGASDVGNNSEVNDLFGFAKDNKPSKLIVRDAYLCEESRIELEKSEFVDMPYTEIKFENTIERITGKAKNPRQIERIPAGACFNVEFVINVWEDDNNGEKLIELLKNGIRALENDYLGGSGSRGYGQIKFGEPNEKEVTFENYFADEN